MPNIIDYKKEYKDLYSPKNEPTIIKVPVMNFAAVEGQGSPNETGGVNTPGEYQKALEVLYAVQYTIKMSKKSAQVPNWYFDYVVPPLEGLWWLADAKSDIKDKSKYKWISMIRLPEFVNKEIFKWACGEASKKKKINTEKAYFFKYAEGLCVQCMHIGPYDSEPQTLALMDKFMSANYLTKDLNENRRHHEIYLCDPRKTAPEKNKTILRIPVKNV